MLVFWSYYLPEIYLKIIQGRLRHVRTAGFLLFAAFQKRKYKNGLKDASTSHATESKKIAA